MNLYFKDLTPEAQAVLLKEAGIKSPQEMNWDVFPITELDFDNEDDDNNIIQARFVSEWENGSVVETRCMLNLNTKEVFAIETADADPDSNLAGEYVILPDGSKEPVTCLFELTDLPVDNVYYYYVL